MKGGLVKDFQNYGEYNPEMSEYNPRSFELELELKEIEQSIEKTNCCVCMLKNLAKRFAFSNN